MERRLRLKKSPPSRAAITENRHRHGESGLTTKHRYKIQIKIHGDTYIQLLEYNDVFVYCFTVNTETHRMLRIKYSTVVRAKRLQMLVT